MKKAQQIYSFIILGFLVTFAAAFFFLPFREIAAQRYLHFKLYYIVLAYFKSNFFLCLIFCFFILMLVFAVKTLLRRLNAEILKITKSSYLILINVFIYIVFLIVIFALALSSSLLLRLSARLDVSGDFFVLFTAVFVLLLFLLALRIELDKLYKSFSFKLLSIPFLLILILVHGLVYLNHTRREANVVLVVVDTLRSDHTSIGAYGTNTTPNLLNILQKEGVPFSYCYSNSPWTLPSVASLLTSQYPGRIDMNRMDSKLADRHVTLAELLKNRGYHTCGLVSHIYLKRKYGLSQGFDIYNEDICDDRDFNHFTISSPAISQLAEAYIERYKNRKFFLFLHYFDPHQAYYDHDKKMAYDGDFVYGTPLEEIYSLIQQKKYSPEDIDYLKYCYDSEIRFTDSYVGKVLHLLKKHKIFDNTLIIFVSDHGEEFVERGFQGHGTSLYNEQIRVPLLFKLPGVREELRNKDSTAPVSLIDVTPTAAGLLGIEPPPAMQGQNIFALDPEDSENRPVFAEVDKTQFGKRSDKVCIISGGWKLIFNLDSGRYELYDLYADSGEQKDRSLEEKEMFAGLKKRLSGWILLNRQQAKRGKKVRLTEEEKKKLESLGYID